MMEKETEKQLEQVLVKALNEGVDLGGILVKVYRIVVEWALYKTHGNQTQVAALLRMNRATVHKYATGKGVPMGARRYKEGKCQDQQKM